MQFEDIKLPAEPRAEIFEGFRWTNASVHKIYNINFNQSELLVTPVRTLCRAIRDLDFCGCYLCGYVSVEIEGQTAIARPVTAVRRLRL